MRLDATQIVVAGITLVGSIAGAQIAAGKRAGVAEARIDTAVTTVKQLSLEFERAKVCSIIVPNMWRDNTLVPSSWTVATCHRFATSMGAWNYQVGCILPDVVVLGPVDGGVPSPNCGWTE
jgi:hypothetical protein